MKKVEIHWKDSNSRHEWHSKDEIPNISYIVTIGYPIYDDDCYIVLAQSVDLANDM
jgi:hypothetical protein